MNKLPITIFHYCTGQSFFEIITFKKLWLNSLFETNDYLERRWLDGILKKKLEEKQGNTQEYITFSKSVQILYTLNNEMVVPYFFSFSQHKDLLSQWRGYADDGQGFALGFNPQFFEISYNVPFTSANPEDAIGIFDVIYDQKGLNQRVDETISFYWKHFEADNYVQNSPAMIECVVNLVRLATRAKNPSFSEEHEWRICYTPIIRYGRGKHEILGKLTPMKFRIKNGNHLTSYFEFPFNAPALTAIVIGPKNNTFPETIRDFLFINGFDITKIEIAKSNASYR
jgi:hypothetical protein